MHEASAWAWPEWLAPIEPGLWVLAGALLLFLLWEAATLVVVLFLSVRARLSGRRGRSHPRG